MECNYKRTDRSGLYIMVFIPMIGSCQSSDKLDKQNKKIEKLEQQMNKMLLMSADEKINL